MIRAYPDQLSLLPGETLRLCVGTDHPEFRVVIYRQGTTLTPMQDFGYQPTRTIGQAGAAGDADWGWDTYDFVTSADWPSGVYIAMLYERDANGETPPDNGVATADGQFGKALFVVRSPTPGVTSSLLYKVPIAMYHAYNHSGGNSLYAEVTGRVSMRRPGGGTGGEVTPFTPPEIGDHDAFDEASSRQTFEHWDAKFVRWLEGNGFHVDYCADLDIHSDNQLELLKPYGLVVCVGHDEYWSPQMRANLEAYIEQGGNVAFFSGNTCWWRIAYDQHLGGFACNHIGDPKNKDSDNYWAAARFDRNVKEENFLTGVSYRNGGGWWWVDSPPREALPFTVLKPDHWAFEPGVPAGFMFGGPEHLVGYECDGAELKPDCAHHEPTYLDGTPPTFNVIAAACLHDGWNLPDRDPVKTSAKAAPRACTMGTYQRVGTVFNAPTADWSRVLEGGEPTVVRVTTNVLNRLGGAPKGLTELAQIDGLVAVDGFFSPVDRKRHAIVGDAQGTVTDVSYDPRTGQSQTVLTNVADIVDVAGFYSDNEAACHVLVATGDGNVTDVQYKVGGTPTQTVLTNLAGNVALSGFYSGDDHYDHAIVLTRDGTLREVFYRPQVAAGVATLGSFAGAVDVGSFFSSDDNYRHAVVSMAAGDLIEVFFKPQSAQGRATLTSVAGGLARVAAYYVSGDAYFSRRVTGVATDGRIYEVRFSPTAGMVRSLLFNRSGTKDVGAFWTSDDGYRHVILGDANGSIAELFYTP